MSVSYIGGANQKMALSPHDVKPLLNVDTITINLPYTLCQSEKKTLDYLLSLKLKPLSQHDNDYKHETQFSLGERAKLKVTNYYGQKALKLTFYGLYQYSVTFQPLNALKTALSIIERILNDFADSEESYIGGENPSIAHVDLCYDLQYPLQTVIPLDTFANYLKTHYQNPVLYHTQNILTGIKAGNKDSRFKFTVYDKIAKESYIGGANLTRIEKRFREKQLKPVPTASLGDLHSYLDLIKYEFAEELLTLDNLFKNCKELPKRDKPFTLFA